MTAANRLLQKHDIQSVIYSLIRAAVCRSRNLGQQEFAWQLQDQAHWLNGQGLTLDSMERMDIASQTSALFDLYDSDIGDRLLIANSLEQYTDLVYHFSQCNSLHFCSSGTTGQPIQTAHTIARLSAEAKAYAKRLPIQRVISLVPAHHIYGFIWGILLARVLNLKALEYESANRALHGGLRPGDLIVGLPLWWKYLARSNARFPKGVIGVTSTAPMDVDVWRSLEQQGLQSLFEVYGASELGGIGLRSHWDSPFELLDCWRPTDNDAGRLTHRDGHLSARLPDHLEFTASRHFWMHGRRDHQVQVAGFNVCPEAIARRLSQLAHVVSCQVRLMTAGEGDRLKAQLVTDHVLNQDSRNAIRDWCARNLSAPERPHLTFTVQKSENALGKAMDWSIDPADIDSTAADRSAATG